MPSICEFDIQVPFSPSTQYALRGLQTPRNKKTNTLVNSAVIPMSSHMECRTLLESTIRSKNRQIEILVRPRVMKT